MMPKSKQKLLITGISGFLGSHFLKMNHPDWAFVGTYHQQVVSSSQMKTFGVDLSDQQGLADLLEQIQPAAIFHLAALSQANFCEKEPELSFSVNVVPSIRLAEYCSNKRIPYLFASSDLVFNGLDGPYREESSTSPVSVYGAHKVAAEQGILAAYPEAIIARLPLMYGVSEKAANFMSNWLSNLRLRKTIGAFTDEYRTAAFAGDVIAGLFLLLQQKTSGIWHLGGPERMSRYDFAVKLAAFHDLPINLVQSVLQKDIQMTAQRPPDVSLDSGKAIALGYQPRGFGEVLREQCW